MIILCNFYSTHQKGYWGELRRLMHLLCKPIKLKIEIALMSKCSQSKLHNLHCVNNAERVDHVLLPFSQGLHGHLGSYVWSMNQRQVPSCINYKWCIPFCLDCFHAFEMYSTCLLMVFHIYQSKSYHMKFSFSFDSELTVNPQQILILKCVHVDNDRWHYQSIVLFQVIVNTSSSGIIDPYRF